MSDSAEEIELAFTLTKAAADRVAAMVEDGPLLHLAAQYYDTPDLALRKAGFALRIRRENGRWMQTLKSGTPGALIRDEFEREVLGGGLDLDLLEAAKLPPHLAARLVDLKPIFETRIDRRLILISRPDAQIELALDQGDVICGDRRTSILEFELELKAGRPAALFHLARELSGEGGVRLTLTNKADRGFAMARVRIPSASHAVSLQVKAFMRLSDALGALGGAALQAFDGDLDQLAIRVDGGSLRRFYGSTGRLRSLLQAFAPFIRLDGGPQVRALRRLQDASAEALALDGFARECSDLLADGRKGSAAVGKSLRALRRVLRRQVQAMAVSDTCGRLLLSASEIIASPSEEEPPSFPPDFALEQLCRRELALRQRLVRGVATKAPALRDLRVSAEDLQALLSVFAPLFPGSRSGFAAWGHALEHLIRPLRELEDTASAGDIMKRLTAELQPQNDDIAAKIGLLAKQVLNTRSAQRAATRARTKAALDILAATPSISA